MVSKRLRKFSDFVREQGVVGLAVGLAIGTQASILVKDIVSSIIDPIIGLLIGNSGGLKAATLKVAVGSREATFTFGSLAYSTIVFVSVCLVVYILVNVFKLDKLDKKKEK